MWLQRDGDRTPPGFHPEAGCWIAINPFKEYEHREKGEYIGKRVEANVASFRYVMIESDTRTKAQQFEDLKNSGFPIAFVIDSGGDSLHAWVKVDAPDAKEWERRKDIIYQVMADCGFDVSNKDASRLSRLPGVPRGGNFQSLVAQNIGAASWDEWEESADFDDGLPDIESPEEFLSGRGKFRLLALDHRLARPFRSSIG